MGKSFFKRSPRASTGSSAPFTSTIQPKITTDENPASPATKAELEKAPVVTTVESSKTMKEEVDNNEAQPADGTTEQEEAPKEGELNTETMIQVLRNKLGLHTIGCDENAELTSLSDEMEDISVNTSNEEEEDASRPPVVHQHEKIVLEDLNGSLAFLTFSRFAVVEETTHLLIKVRACTFSPNDAKKCSGSGLSKAMLPYVPGQVIVGTIEDIGSDVDSFFEIGDRVIGMVEGGGCSRFLSAEAENFVKAPSNLGNSTALALMQDWMPAYRALHKARNAIKRANLFGMNVLITDAMLPAGQAVIALANEEGANIYCCADEAHHGYLESLGSKITCLGPQPEQWLSTVREQMDVVIDNTCSDGYVSSCEALRRKGVLITLPYVTFDDNKLFGLFDISSFDRKMKNTKANMTMCQTIAVDTKEEFKLYNEDDTNEERMNFVRDFQYLASLHDKGIINPRISEKVSLQEVSGSHHKFRNGIVGRRGGTVVCFPWKKEGEQ